MIKSYFPNPDFAPLNELVVVVGAAGHVGLPLAVACSEVFNTVGLDINKPLCDQLNKGVVPFVEHGLKFPMQESLDRGSLYFTTDEEFLTGAKYILITIGTPVDAEGNASVKDIVKFFTYTLIPALLTTVEGSMYPVVMLRSTVSPGTTRMLRGLLDNSGLEEVILAFCPERVLQTRGYEEIRNLAQLIGVENDHAWDVVSAFFWRLSDKGSVERLTYEEAEVAKLITNMARYVEFALANEFYILGDYLGTEDHPVNIHKVIEAAKRDYPRLAHLPLPGPNVGGPCLFKDGKFLLKNSPFINGLVNTAFTINEGVPGYLYHKAKKLHGNVKKICILGMTFKADCDDTRNSLSYKLKKIAEADGVEVVWVDPYVPDKPDSNFENLDVVFLMTPHSSFLDSKNEIFQRFSFKSPWQTFLFVDMWKKTPVGKNSADGFVFIKQQASWVCS